MKRVNEIGLIAVLGVILSGCGGSYWKWSKPGATEQRARQDGFECKQIARQPYLLGTGKMLIGGAESDFTVWKECLEARGYTVTEQNDSQSSSQSAPTNPAPQSNGCVAANATIGSILTTENGQKRKVTALYGMSPACTKPTHPILANIADYVGPSATQLGNGCVAETVNVGSRMAQNGIRKKVAALYGTSPLCIVAAIPILAYLQDDIEANGNACVSTTATVGSQVKLDGKAKTVNAVYGTSPRCTNATMPILADLHDDPSASQSLPSNLKDIADPDERLRKWRENDSTP
jgi:hypothetical protein